MGAGNATVPKRRHRRGLSLTLVALAVFIVAAGTAYVVADNRRPAPLDTGPGSVPRGVAKVLPGVGAFVPAYDLTSDPVFPTLTTGYAIESHRTKAGTSEQLARSDDGGRSWHLVGPFPFPNGYAQVQFYSLRDGYAFGPAGLAVTYDGGSIWKVGAQLDGTLERVSPIGNNVWATYTVCRGFPLTPTTSCNVRLAVSQDAGLHWSTQATPSPLSEARLGRRHPREGHARQGLHRLLRRHRRRRARCDRRRRPLMADAARSLLGLADRGHGGAVGRADLDDLRRAPGA